MSPRARSPFRRPPRRCRGRDGHRRAERVGGGLDRRGREPSSGPRDEDRTNARTTTSRAARHVAAGVPSTSLAALAALATSLPPVALAHGDAPRGSSGGAESPRAETSAESGTTPAPRRREIVRPRAAETMSPSLGGRWSAVRDWPLVAVHAALLPNGKVLAWDATPDDADDDPHTTDNYTTRVTLWDPVTDTHTETNNDTDTDLFCAGSAHLWDGRILFAGGDGGRAGANGPLPNTNLYEPSTNTWRRVINMNAPRWYSSVAALGNGEMLTFGGTYEPDPIAEVFRFDRTWRALGLEAPPGYEEAGQGLYQWMQAAPDGSVVLFGPQNMVASLDTEGRGSFVEGPPRDDVQGDDGTAGGIDGAARPPIGEAGLPDADGGASGEEVPAALVDEPGVRSYGSYAMFDVGRILVAGGGDSLDTAVVVDTATRQSGDTGRLNIGRRQHNLTILADGSVLVTGGNDDGSELVSETGAVYTPEIWNPATGRFTALNPMNADRQYHSVALLLADGRVLSAGGGICGRCYDIGYEERNGAVYSPPYLFAADASPARRPTIAEVPAEAGYGARLTLAVDAETEIVKAHLIKLGSATHSTNQDQRLVPLAFGRRGASLELDMPRSRDVAPPGHYLLFVVDATGVPSEGAFVKLGQPLLAPGERLVGTLEPGAWDSVVVPADAGTLEVVVNGDAPLELYVSAGAPTRDDNVAEASCRALLPNARRQSCTVSADAPTPWYVTVHGASRTDYRLDSSGTRAAPEIAEPAAPGSAPGETPGRPVAETSDATPEGAGDVATPVDDGGAGGGAVTTGGSLSPLAALVLTLSFAQRLLRAGARPRRR